MTLDTILLIGHGSREQSGNDEIFAFAEQWRQRQPGWRIEVCFIEFSEITMGEGLRRAAAGAHRVVDARRGSWVVQARGSGPKAKVRPLISVASTRT